MKALLKILFIIFSFIFISYLVLPNPSFPTPPPDALQSDEPADTEDPLRRAYFTDFSREEIMLHYNKQFEKSSLFSLPLPTYRLNYPPEEAQTNIRDQTRSTFLEEIVHPFRESLFVNGFEAKDSKDTILIEDKIWNYKITIRYVPSNILVRVSIGLFTLALASVLFREWRKVLK